jgi:hypothetical protein
MNGWEITINKKVASEAVERARQFSEEEITKSEQRDLKRETAKRKEIYITLPLFLISK